MSKKIHSSGYPRKFIDKIALIKQKEALTNAYFESAIQGLSDISVKRVPKNKGSVMDDLRSKYHPNENIHNKLKDDLSNTSFSPLSFTSDSSTSNPQTTDSYAPSRTNSSRESNNEVFKSFYEAPDNSYRNSQIGAIKFRHGSDNSNVQLQQSRLSNIEGYHNFHYNSNMLMDFTDQVSSGSLPDVSTFNKQNHFQSDIIDKNINHDSINMKEVLLSYDKMKKELNSKQALYEHLKTRGFQSNMHPHPHHIANNELSPKKLPSALNNPSINRNRAGYVHNHDDSVCAASNTDRGYMKHYKVSNIPYLSLPVGDMHYTEDCDNPFRKRHVSGNIASQSNHMQLKLTNVTDVKNDGPKYKSLTPTGNQQRNWLCTTNETHLLPPVIYGTISADNYRRVASDSAIQNSLKECISNTSQNNFSYYNDGNSYKNRYCKDDPTVHMSHRIKSLTSERTKNVQDTSEELFKPNNLERDISISSSFLDNYIDPSTPDENLDPNMELTTPLKLGNFNKFSEESSFNSNDIPRYSYENDNSNPSQIYNSTQQFNISDSTNNEGNFDINSNMENNKTQRLPELNDECYWTLPSGSHQKDSSREPSPKIKPCENLHPENVDVDLNTNFSWIPEITMRPDENVPRRDSLNMAVEVLNDLNMESTFHEMNQYRDKLNGFGGCYQPMDSLSEETSMKTFENEY